MKSRVTSIIHRILRIPLTWYTNIFLPIEVHGELPTNQDEPFIIAANHVSDWDPIVLSIALRKKGNALPLFFVCRNRTYYLNRTQGIRKYIYGGILFQLLGGVAIQPSYKDYATALATHIYAIERGYPICIFPEGKKNPDREKRKAHGGVGFLSTSTASRVIPTAIQYKSRPRRRAVVTFGDLTKPPLSDKASSLDDVCIYQEYASAVMTEVKQLVENETL